MPNESIHHAGDTADLAPDAVGPGYEVRDSRARPILIFIAGLFLFMVVAQVFLWGLLKGITGERKGVVPEEAKVEARVQTNASASLENPAILAKQLADLRAAEGQALAGEGPLPGDPKDRVRVSIGRAIDLLSERGIPATRGPARTEIEVNAHSGGPIPVGPEKDNNKGRDQDKDKDNDQPRPEGAKPGSNAPAAEKGAR